MPCECSTARRRRISADQRRGGARAGVQSDEVYADGIQYSRLRASSDAGQTGLALRFSYGTSSLYWYGPGCNQYLPLTETAPGTYTAQWDAVTYCNFSNPYPHVLPDTNYTVYVRDAAGNQSSGDGCRHDPRGQCSVGLADADQCGERDDDGHRDGPGGIEP